MFLEQRIFFVPGGLCCSILSVLLTRGHYFLIKRQEKRFVAFLTLDSLSTTGICYSTAFAITLSFQISCVRCCPALDAKQKAYEPYCDPLWEYCSLSQSITLWFCSTSQMLTLAQWTRMISGRAAHVPVEGPVRWSSVWQGPVWELRSRSGCWGWEGRGCTRASSDLVRCLCCSCC